MSDMWTDGDLDEILGNTGDNSTIKVLREKIKADNAAMKQMQEQIKTLSAANLTPMVKDALKSAGLTENAYKGYKGEADPTAVQAWVEANKDWIAPAGTPAAPIQSLDEDPPQSAGAPAPGTAPAVFTPDSQAAYQRMITAGVDGVPGSNFTEALGGLQAAQTMEELMAIIAKNG